MGSLVNAALGRPRGLGDVPSKSSADLKNAAFSDGASSKSFQIAGKERFFSLGVLSRFAWSYSIFTRLSYPQ